MKRFLLPGIAAVLSATLLVGLSACTNENYDVSDVNKEITLAGNGLTLPLGSTSKLTMKSLLEDFDTEMLHVLSDGSYAFSVSDELDLSSVLPDFVPMDVVHDAEVSSIVSIPVHTQGNIVDKFGNISDWFEGVEMESFDVTMSDDFEFTMLQSSYAQDYIKGIERISFENASLNIDLSFYNLPDFGEGRVIEVDMTLELPKEMVLDQTDERVEGNTVKIASSLVDGVLLMEPVSILALDLSEFDFSAGEDLVGRVSAECEIFVKNPILSFHYGDTDMSIAVSINNLSVEEIVAHVQYEIDGEEQHIAMDGFPDFMKEESFVLDIRHPHMMITATTNMGIPAEGTLLIKPVVNGVIHEDDGIEVDLAMPASENSNEFDTVTYWIGDDSTLCPEGCVFVQAEIGKLIKKIPDEFVFMLSSHINEVEDCVLVPSADYDFDIDYDFVIPLDFGEDLHMELSETMGGFSGVFGQMLEKNSVQLTGDVTSTLPIQLELNIEMLDVQGNVVEMASPVSMVIAPCNADGSASVSPLSLTLEAAKGASIQAVDALRLSFIVTAPGTGGPIREDEYVQANLKLSLPHGITIDLEELNS